MAEMISILATSLLAAVVAAAADGQNTGKIPAGIEKLHESDTAATIARDVDALTALWVEDGVLLQPGNAPIVGKTALHDFMKQAVAKSPSVTVVKYVPDIRDIQVSGNVAYEWGYFEAAQKGSEQQAPETMRAKLLRVMRRQSDGSWKFARVMWLPD